MLAVLDDFEVEVGPGRASGRADQADLLARRYALPGMGAKARHVGIAGDQAVAVVDLDAVAITLPAPGKTDCAGGGGEDRCADVALEIEPGVEGPAAGKRVGAIAEA